MPSCGWSLFSTTDRVNSQSHTHITGEAGAFRISCKCWRPLQHTTRQHLPLPPLLAPRDPYPQALWRTSSCYPSVPAEPRSWLWRPPILIDSGASIPSSFPGRPQKKYLETLHTSKARQDIFKKYHLYYHIITQTMGGAHHCTRSAAFSIQNGRESKNARIGRKRSRS